MAYARVLLLDLTDAAWLPGWAEKIGRRVFPVEEGKHEKEYDLREDLLPPEEVRLIREMTGRAHLLLHGVAADESLPVGFGRQTLPAGAKLGLGYWPLT